MISFRYHLTTLVAVFLALAVGVVLGGGPLSELGRDEPAKASADTGAVTRADEARNQAEKALTEAAPKVYGKGLEGRTVTVLRLPGVAETTLDGVQAQIEAAGGTSQVWEATEGLVGAGDKALVDTLGSQLATQLPEGTVTEGASTYVRIGELIAGAVASKKETGEGATGDSATILESLHTAKLLDGPATAPTRAPLVLVLAADPATDKGVDVIHEGLVSGLSTRSLGVVVATSTGAALGESLVAKKLDAGVAIGDGVDTTAGQVATVTALVRSVTTRGGRFGASVADGFLLLG